MPLVMIHMFDGRGPEKKKALMKEVTEAICRTLEVKPDSVRVILQEVAREDWAVAGVPIEEYR